MRLWIPTLPIITGISTNIDNDTVISSSLINMQGTGFKPLKLWLQAINTAVVSGTMISMLLKQYCSDTRMLFKEIYSAHLGVRFSIHSVF